MENWYDTLIKEEEEEKEQQQPLQFEGLNVMEWTSLHCPELDGDGLGLPAWLDYGSAHVQQDHHCRSSPSTTTVNGDAYEDDPDTVNSSMSLVTSTDQLPFFVKEERGILPTAEKLAKSQRRAFVVPNKNKRKRKDGRSTNGASGNRGRWASKKPRLGVMATPVVVPQGHTAVFGSAGPSVAFAVIPVTEALRPVRRSVRHREVPVQKKPTAEELRRADLSRLPRCSPWGGDKSVSPAPPVSSSARKMAMKDSGHDDDTAPLYTEEKFLCCGHFAIGQTGRIMHLGPWQTEDTRMLPSHVMQRLPLAAFATRQRREEEEGQKHDAQDSIFLQK